MRRGKPQFDYELCMACHVCEQACITSVINCSHPIKSQGATRLYPELSDSEACTGCGICERSCPVTAIQLV